MSDEADELFRLLTREPGITPEDLQYCMISPALWEYYFKKVQAERDEKGEK
jgi:hypothetical protein